MLLVLQEVTEKDAPLLAAAKLAWQQTSRLLLRQQHVPEDRSKRKRASCDSDRCGLLQEVTEKDPLVLASAKLARQETGRLLRRLHVPEDKSQKKAAALPHQRHFGKLCRGHLLVVLETALSTVSPFCIP